MNAWVAAFLGAMVMNACMELRIIQKCEVGHEFRMAQMIYECKPIRRVENAD